MRIGFRIGLVAVAAIAVGSVVGALIVHEHDRDNFERTQRDEALRSARQAQAVSTLSVGQLATAAAFFQAERRFDRHQFTVVTRPLLSRGVLNATGFVQRVTAGQRPAYESAHGFPIIERRPGGLLGRAGERPVYYPLTYAADDRGIPPPLGYDLDSDPLRAPYLEKARDTGIAAATSVMRLPSGGVGINVYRPVYRDGAPVATTAERRRALVGFAAAGFRVADLAAAAMSAVPSDVVAQLREGGRRVFGARGTLGDSASAPIKLADRSWLLVVHDPSGPGVSLPLLMAVVGISLAALLGALILVWSRNEHMQELQNQANQDSLTGLKNRRRFEEDLHTEMARARRDRNTAALLMLDLDNFKTINDSLGHQAGDRVIEEIAGVLQGRTRETDVLARLGGDEFAIVLPRCDETEALSVAEAIATAVREHEPKSDGTAQITASIGIAMFGADPRISSDTLLSEADAAMYAAKDAGRDTVRVFDPKAVREEALSEGSSDGSSV
jgi:diguanylate cyclase (GGDEF)-like protein